MSTSSPSPSSQEVQRLRESADWLIRLSNGALDGGTLSDEELAAWIRWYESDSANARAFEEMQTLWDSLGQLERSDLSTQLLARHAQERRTPAGQRDPDDVHVGSKVARGFARSFARTFAWSGALAAAGAGAWALLTFVILPTPQALAPNGAMATQLAEKQEAVLPDGSTVALGAQSSLALEYVPTGRYLKLTNGQAYFNVAKDKTRPFAVDAGEITIQAHGTAFDVRKNDGRVAVTVTEGIVDVITAHPLPDADGVGGAVANPAAPIRVTAGYQLIWDKGNKDGRKKTLQLSHVDTAGMTAWREGRLEYVNEPLSVVIADVNRYSPRRLVIEGTDLGSLNFTGTILVDSIGNWLTAIQLSFPVSVRNSDDGAVIIRRRGSGESAITSTLPVAPGRDSAL